MKDSKKYAFEIAQDANKIQVAESVKQLYKVDVEKVNIIVEKPKEKRVRGRFSGFTKFKKKAIVTLKKGEIDFFKVK